MFKNLVTHFSKIWPLGIIEFNAIRFSNDPSRITRYFDMQFRDHVNSGSDYHHLGKFSHGNSNNKYGKESSKHYNIINSNKEIRIHSVNINRKEFHLHENDFNRELDLFGSEILRISVDRRHLDNYNLWLNNILNGRYSQINKQDIVPRILFRCHRNLYEDCWVNDIINKDDRLHIDSFDRYINREICEKSSSNSKGLSKNN